MSDSTVGQGQLQGNCGEAYGDTVAKRQTISQEVAQSIALVEAELTRLHKVKDIVNSHPELDEIITQLRGVGVVY